MAQRKIVQLIDDLDQSVITEGDGSTVEFALDGKQYEIDLSAAHLEEMRSALAPFIAKARVIGMKRGRLRGSRP